MRFDFRFATSQPGVSSQHALSAGPHYDPALLSFGPVIGCDRHEVAPGAGFDWHAHAGVVIVSLVLAGTLRHEGSAGEPLLVAAGGPVLVQACGGGIRHRETNPSPSEPLVLVQTTLLLDRPQATYLAEAPVDLGDGVVFGSSAGTTFVCGPVVVSIPWSASISAD